MVQTRVITASPRFSLTLLFADVYEGFKLHEVWREFGIEAVKQRYLNSALGLLWIAISFVLFVVGISFFFSSRMSDGAQISYPVYIAIGYTAFQYILANFIDGGSVFLGSSGWIKSTSMPYSVYVYMAIFRTLLPFAIHLTVAMIILVYFGGYKNWNWNTLYVFPAFGIYLLCAIPVKYAMGLLGARFRDVGHGVAATSRLLFFVSPVVWVREGMGGMRAVIADFNPITHFLEIFRNPLLGIDVRPLSWVVVISITIFAWICAAVGCALFKHRLPFWI